MRIYIFIQKKSYICRRMKIRMARNDVIEIIRQVANDVLPKGSELYLYGSRARGDFHDDSDWDLLLLLDKQEKGADDFAKYAYPIMECGFDLW